MFILGTYVGVACTLFSAVVCWRCFAGRRRFPSAIFVVCGVLSATALLWSGMCTATETALAQDDVLLSSIGAFKASGDIEPDATLEYFRRRIAARNNSIILTNVALSFVVTVVAGLLAAVAYRRAIASKGNDANVPSTSA